MSWTIWNRRSARRMKLGQLPMIWIAKSSLMSVRQDSDVDGDLVGTAVGLEVALVATLDLGVRIEIVPDRLPHREHHLRHLAVAVEDQVVAALDPHARRAVRHGDAGRDVEGAVGVGLVVRVDAEEPHVVDAVRRLLVDPFAEEAVPQGADAGGLRIALVAVGGACGESRDAEGFEALKLGLHDLLHHRFQGPRSCSSACMAAAISPKSWSLTSNSPKRNLPPQCFGSSTKSNCPTSGRIGASRAGA